MRMYIYIHIMDKIMNKIQGILLQISRNSYIHLQTRFELFQYNRDIWVSLRY